MKKVSLSSVATVVAGIGFPEQFQGRATGKYPFYKVGDISRAWQAGQRMLGRAEHYVDDDARIEMGGKPIPPGATAFAKIGAAVALNRRAMLTVPALLDNNCFAVVPTANVLDAAFLFYFMCSVDLGKRTRATTVPSLRKGDVESLELPAWPIQRQHHIVAAIETQFTRLDAAVATLERVSANLKRARASVLKAAVEGRLVPTEAELARAEGRPYEPASVLLQRILEEHKSRWPKGKKYVAPVAPEVEGLPELPEGWLRTTLEAIGDWGSGGTPSRSRPEFYGGHIPWIKTGELADGDLYDSEEKITQEGLQGSSAKLFPPGTLLVAMYGATIGMTARLRIEASTNQACAALRPSPSNDVMLPFVWKYLISQREAFRRVGQGGAQPNISQTVLKAWPIPVPPLAEQARIVAEVERRLSLLDKLDATVELNLTRCNRLRQSILKRAFEGKLVPQDPQDEPAAVLLDRIQSAAKDLSA